MSGPEALAAVGREAARRLWVALAGEGEGVDDDASQGAWEAVSAGLDSEGRGGGACGALGWVMRRCVGAECCSDAMGWRRCRLRWAAADVWLPPLSQVQRTAWDARCPDAGT